MKVTSELKDFQKETVSRMVKMEKKYDGGFILSHAGTGKTICVLQHYVNKPTRTLVICPAGLINNWVDEINKHTRGLEYTLYYGKDRQELELGNFVLTTYSTICSEYKKNPKFLKTKFGRVVLDESHYIRNDRSKITQGIIELINNNINSKRWVITATPIFNKTDDLYTSFKILGLYETKSQWNTDINRSICGLKVLNELLTKYSIKYKKEDVLKELNSKNEVTTSIEFNKTEREFYDTLKNYSQERISKLVRSISVFKKNIDYNKLRLVLRSHVLTLILRLKQACDSPMLVMSKMKRLQGTSSMNEAMKILTLNKAEDDCPICYDAKASHMADPCGHSCCKDCWDKLFDVGIMDCPTCRTFVEEIEEIKLKKLKIKKIENGQKENSEAVFMSSKMLAMFKIIKEKINKGEKVVVVSQWVKMLDIIRELVNERYPKLKYVSLQGNISIKNRTQNIKSFETDPSIRICFISLLSSAEGINLVSANNMILLDSWWNNAKMNQVMNRCHRIGQVKDVNIYKFQINNTIEERIKDMVDRKSKISDIVVNNWEIKTSDYDDKWLKNVVKLI